MFPNCTCGHTQAEHHHNQCLECQREDHRCTCDEIWGGLDPFNGCRVCTTCEDYTTPKPAPAPQADPNQIALFGHAEVT
jgi:hypothetical protein